MINTMNYDRTFHKLGICAGQRWRSLHRLRPFVERCPPEAVTMDVTNQHVVNFDRCFGGNVCATGCTSFNCTLTQQKSTIRISSQAPNGKYARQGSDETRFNDYYCTVQSIVTSSAQSDSGLFETNLRDERYLPFEGTGIPYFSRQAFFSCIIPESNDRPAALEFRPFCMRERFYDRT